MAQQTVKLDDCFSELRELVRRVPLSEAERENQYTNIRALRKLRGEWERLSEENEQLKQQLKGQEDG